MPITSLVFEHFPGICHVTDIDEKKGDETKYFTMAVTPDRIIQFVGGPTLDQALSHPIYRVLPGSLPNSLLKCFSVRGGLFTVFFFPSPLKLKVICLAGEGRNIPW